MPTSFSHIDLCLVTLPLPLLQLLQNYHCYFCHHYHYFHTTLLLNTLLQILSYPGGVELTTQLLILENILWLPLCRINKFGLNTLPSKTVAIPYTCGLSMLHIIIQWCVAILWCPSRFSLSYRWLINCYDWFNLLVVMLLSFGAHHMSARMDHTIGLVVCW